MMRPRHEGRAKSNAPLEATHAKSCQGNQPQPGGGGLAVSKPNAQLARIHAATSDVITAI
jgi:hypothetical protein